jgi:hypothetical protein
MRSKLQSLRVGVCSAAVCAAALLMATFILLLPLRMHRFVQCAGASIDRGVFPASQTLRSAPAESFTASHGTRGAALDKADPIVHARAPINLRLITLC